MPTQGVVVAGRHIPHLAIILLKIPTRVLKINSGVLKINSRPMSPVSGRGVLLYEVVDTPSGQVAEWSDKHCQVCGVPLHPTELRGIELDGGTEYLCDACLGISN